MKAKKCVILVAIMMGAITLSGCDGDSSEEATPKAAQVEKERKITEEVQALCSKHNAVRDWGESRLFPYTIDVQDALIRTDGRPVLFFARVTDVTKKADKYSVHFEASFVPTIHLFLDCTSDQIKQLMLQRKDWPEFYAVIATVSEVNRIKFEITTSLYSEEIFLESVPFGLDFICKGKCLDLLFVGRYGRLDFDKYLAADPKTKDD